METKQLLATWAMGWLAAAGLAEPISTVQFASASFSVSETGGVARITVERIGQPGGIAWVEYSTSPAFDASATDGTDYIGQRGGLYFEGETHLTIEIPILNDSLVESTESLLITLFNPDPFTTELGAIGTTSLGIVDNDRGVEFSSAIYEIDEPGGSVTILLQRSGEPDGAFSVDYTTGGDSAMGGKDLTPANGTVHFAAGETNKTFTLCVRDDYLGEGDEAVDLTLSNLMGNAVIGLRNTAVLVIRDDEQPELDLEHWLVRNQGTTPWLYGVAAGAGTIVAVGTTILTSTDGRRWSEQASPTSTTLYSAAHGNGVYVAVGGFCTLRGLHSVILSSDSGTDWVERYNGFEVLYGVSYGNGMFAAVGGWGDSQGCGSGTVLTSRDGVTWTERYRNPLKSFHSVTSGRSGFVAVGAAGAVLRSTDGVDWVEGDSGTSEDLFAAAYGNGTFVAVGGYDPGMILSTTDGITWTGRHTISNYHFAAATYGAGTFLAAGYDRRLFTSQDGREWTSRDSGGGSSFSDAVFANGSFLVVGSNGSIVQSAARVRPGFNPAATHRLADGTLCLVLEVEPDGAAVAIEASSDLSDWVGLGTTITWGGNVEFSDQDAYRFPRRFYRAAVLPQAE